MGTPSQGEPFTLEQGSWLDASVQLPLVDETDELCSKARRAKVRGSVQVF